MNQIILFTEHRKGWMAQYLGPHRAKIVELFNTDVLPTAFASDALAEDVIREVSRLNPGVQVSSAMRA